ncbi:MAG: RNA polymerase sigma factor [Bacteroidota bacterium]
MSLFKNHNADDDELKRAAEGLRAGSAEAFHLLYGKYQQSVYRFCLRMIGDEAAAKDAFQETFLKVYEHRAEFKGNNFSAWLFTISRHVCLNSLRSLKRFDTFSEEIHTEEIAERGDLGMQMYIQRALALLPIPLREAIILREYEGYSYQEIADIVGVDLSLAKVRVHRARIILRRLLAPLVKENNES